MGTGSSIGRVRFAPARAHHILVRTLSDSKVTGRLRLGPLDFPCVLGRAGVSARKREGDGASPRGLWPVREVFYRPDRMMRPRCGMPPIPLEPSDGWCDESTDRNYNRRVTRPYPASAEAMWREDHLYDVVVVLGYNERPRVRGRGSAIFLHLSRPERTPTAGCIALELRYALRLLPALRRGMRIRLGR